MKEEANGPQAFEPLHRFEDTVSGPLRVVLDPLAVLPEDDTAAVACVDADEALAPRESVFRRRRLRRVAELIGRSSALIRRAHWAKLAHSRSIIVIKASLLGAFISSRDSRLSESAV